MSATNLHPPVQRPDLRQLLSEHRAEILRTLNCAQLGRVVSFDQAKGTVVVQLVLKRVVANRSTPACRPTTARPFWTIRCWPTARSSR